MMGFNASDLSTLVFNSTTSIITLGALNRWNTTQVIIFLADFFLIISILNCIISIDIKLEYSTNKLCDRHFEWSYNNRFHDISC